MMMILMMSKFMLDECAGGCKGRLLIDIFHHTHCTNMIYCLPCRSCPAQLSCDLTMCLNASCVCLFEDASVGYPILPVDTEDRSEYALLELFEHFHMATVGDPCLTAI